nr:UTP--glucose-1-phosphate uridylyltransferase [Ipomoea batatas]
MFRSFSSRRFSLVFLIILLLGDGSYGSSIGSRKSGSSVFSLFNLKDKSRFWSESVIRTDLNDLESSGPDKMDILNYTKAGSIANYLKLLEIDSIYLPIPVNFIFIGFEGKGNLEFKLQPEEMERWFTKIDHIFDHTRIPQIGEVLTPFYKISIDKEQRHHLPLISHLSYNFSVHAIQMGEKVTSIFERAIDVFGRKDDVLNTRDDGEHLWQVDVDMMEVVFNSLVEYLQLEDAYNIFILNPKRAEKRVKYGYRFVFGIVGPLIFLFQLTFLRPKDFLLYVG